MQQPRFSIQRKPGLFPFKKYAILLCGMLQRTIESFPHLTKADHKATAKLFHEFDSKGLMTWATENLETFETPEGVDFRMVVDIGEDPNKVIVAPGEFGGELKPFSVARALALRAIACPEATLVMQPNDVIGRPSMNYTKAEYHDLAKGSLKPLIGRIAIVLDSLHNPDKLAMYGPSQGGIVALGFAQAERPDAAVAVLEPPNVKDRTRFQMAHDFLGCGRQLPASLAVNFDSDTQFSLETNHIPSSRNRIRYLFKVPTPSNLALVSLLARSDAHDQMKTILENNGSVVHAWAEHDMVSPQTENQQINVALRGYSAYEAVELPGADHSISNFAALGGALMRRAIEIKESN